MGGSLKDVGSSGQHHGQWMAAGGGWCWDTGDGEVGRVDMGSGQWPGWWLRVVEWS